MLIGEGFKSPLPTDLEGNIDHYLAKLELINEECGFSHGPEDLVIEKPLAANYICQYFGDSVNKEIHEQLRIPICQECIEGLKDDDWVIIYCIECNNSQWIYKPISKLDFSQKINILWIDVCPKCKEVSNYNAKV